MNGLYEEITLEEVGQEVWSFCEKISDHIRWAFAVTHVSTYVWSVEDDGIKKKCQVSQVKISHALLAESVIVGVSTLTRVIVS